MLGGSQQSSQQLLNDSDDFKWARAVFGTLPGEAQTVPRAEAYAIRAVLNSVDSALNLRIWTDHKNLVTAVGKGLSVLSASLGTSREPCNADLLLDIMLSVEARAGSVELVHVKAHADADEVAKSSCPWRAFCGNEVADEFAKAGAGLAAVAAEDAERVNRILHLNEMVLRRMAAIAMELVKLPVPPEKGSEACWSRQEANSRPCGSLEGHHSHCQILWRPRSVYFLLRGSCCQKCQAVVGNHLPWHQCRGP